VSEQQPSRWRPTRRKLLWASGVAALAFLIIVICGYLFGWKWTGLPKQTLWDWLQLLIVPAVLAIGGYLFTRSENQRTRDAADEQRALDRQIADEQRSLDREIADERRQDEMLQAYLDGMSNMLLPNKDQPSLYKARPGDSLSSVARARTLTVLPRLDGRRKARVVQFLYESGLVSTGHQVVDLRGADLRGATLSEANLVGADLSGTILYGADLRRARLWGANLVAATLEDADLSRAQLDGANLQEAKLVDANLSLSKLSWTNMIEADLKNADLWRTRLVEAQLTSADLRGTNLSEARLTRAYLFKATLGGPN
jgi:hypothetical protein